LREEGKLRVFENMVLRRIFEPRREEVTGEWRILHYDELNDLYSSPNIARVTKSRKVKLVIKSGTSAPA
jgi:hypothetical protein